MDSTEEYLQISLTKYKEDPEKYISYSKKGKIVEVKDDGQTILIIGSPAKSLFPIEKDELDDFQ